MILKINYLAPLFELSISSEICRNPTLIKENHFFFFHVCLIRICACLVLLKLLFSDERLSCDKLIQTQI